MIKPRVHTSFDAETNDILDKLWSEYIIARNWADHTGEEEDYEQMTAVFDKYLNTKREAFAKMRAQ